MGVTSKIVAGIPALLFIFVGLAWWFAPELVTDQLGMELQSGAGLSTQIGDLASFFFTLGGCWLIGLVTGNRVWLFPPIMLLAFAIVGRIIAWLLHGAALTTGIVALETGLIVSLLVISLKIAKRKA